MEISHPLSLLPDSTVHGANMGPIWGRQDPGGSHVGPMNFAIWAIYVLVQFHCGQRSNSSSNPNLNLESLYQNPDKVIDLVEIWNLKRSNSVFNILAPGRFEWHFE